MPGQYARNEVHHRYDCTAKENLTHTSTCQISLINAEEEPMCHCVQLYQRPTMTSEIRDQLVNMYITWGRRIFFWHLTVTGQVQRPWNKPEASLKLGHLTPASAPQQQAWLSGVLALVEACYWQLQKNLIHFSVLQIPKYILKCIHICTSEKKHCPKHLSFNFKFSTPPYSARWCPGLLWTIYWTHM